MSTTAINVGMSVVGADGQPLGLVTAVDADALHVGRAAIPRAAVGRVEEGVVYLLLAASALAARPDVPSLPAGEALAGGAAQVIAAQLVVPVVEERLVVGTRAVELGEIEIRKRVVEETVMQPVTVRREVVEIVHRDADGNEIGVQALAPPGREPEEPR